MRRLFLSLQGTSAGMITEDGIRIVEMYNAVHGWLYSNVLYKSQLGSSSEKLEYNAMSIYNTENNEKRLQESQQYWDDLASTFDNEPDHGLRDTLIRETWTELLKTWLPQTSATILDIGCGTGSLSIVLAGLGHKVTGIDLSPSMISHAQAKAAAQGFQIQFHVMDAVFPQLSYQQFDVIICRHLLWALPEPKQVLQRWVEFLKQKGRLILIEGFWVTGAGLHSQEIIEMLPTSFINVSSQNLSDSPDFWGGSVTDERYAIVADNNK